MCLLTPPGRLVVGVGGVVVVADRSWSLVLPWNRPPLPLCDGLVDAGVVPDDSPEYMRKAMPRIAAPEYPGRLWLVVTELGAGDVG